MTQLVRNSAGNPTLNCFLSNGPLGPCCSHTVLGDFGSTLLGLISCSRPGRETGRPCLLLSWHGEQALHHPLQWAAWGELDLFCSSLCSLHLAHASPQEILVQWNCEWSPWRGFDTDFKRWIRTQSRRKGRPSPRVVQLLQRQREKCKWCWGQHVWAEQSKTGGKRKVVV